MSIWLALWVVISVTLIGFLLWSLYVLFQQKSVWKKFAEKNKLRYKANAMMESPSMDGAFNEYKISFFTSEHANPDLRGFRKMTAVEIGLQTSMPIDGGVASGGMVPLIRELALKSEIQPKHEKWNKSFIAAGENRYVLEAYLTKERLDVLLKLMRIKNGWVIFIFRQGRMLLRLDTPNPLASADSLQKVVDLMLKAASVLEVDPEESKKLKAEEARGIVKDSALTLDDSDVEASGAFELEDDEAVGDEAVDEAVAVEEEPVEEKDTEAAPVEEKPSRKKPKKKK